MNSGFHEDSTTFPANPEIYENIIILFVKNWFEEVPGEHEDIPYINQHHHCIQVI